MADKLNTHGDLVDLTTSLVAAYVSSNSVQRSDVPALIQSVYLALSTLRTPTPEKTERPTPPISTKKSINPDYLVSMEDGHRYKSLRRHLSGRSMTLPEYREKWGLSHDYPMVASDYAKQRSDLTQAMGLGCKREAAPSTSGSEAETAAEPSRRRQRRKAG